MANKELPKYAYAPNKGYGRKATYKTFRQGGDFINDTYVGGRLAQRLVIRELRNKKTGTRKLQRELFIMKPGLPKIYEKAFKAGHNNRMMQVGGERWFYSHLVPEVDRGAPHNGFREKHSVAKSIPSESTVRRALARGSWTGKLRRKPRGRLKE